MNKIKPSNVQSVYLDDLLELDNDEKLKVKKKKKKSKKKNKQTGKPIGKKKNNKKKSKKTENKKYRYVSHKKRFMDKVCDAVDVKVRSKINVDVTDESISNLLSSGINLVTLLLSRKK